jgi:hypothetical protein
MSDELTTGQSDFPANWGFPSDPYNYCTASYTACGMIWYGKGKCTLDDALEVLDDPRTKGRTIDRLTLCGTDDPAWTTEADVLKQKPCYMQSYKL